jgi:MscS family membrane protein
MREFLTAARAGEYEAAAAYLDLRRLPAEERATDPAVLARRVKALLDQTLWVDLESLSDAPEGDLQDGLAPSRERVGEITRGEVTLALELERVASGRAPAWRISAASLRAMSPLLARDVWIERQLPSFWTETRLLEIALWQWLALPALALAAWLAAGVLGLALGRPLRALARRAFGDAQAASSATAPLRLLLSALLFRAALGAAELALPVQRVVAWLAGALAWLAIVWLGARIADAAAQRLGARLLERGDSGFASLLPVGARVVKVLLGAIATLAILQGLGVNVTGILAGLGVGGLAVALAAQKTVENLFGGVSLVADQPVRVGDFCRFGDRLGTVEAIGLRSTRVRTLDRTLVTIPNADFSAQQLENYAERDRIWLKVVLGLRYETTPDRLRQVLERLRKLLKDDPRVDPDPARVRFVAFGAYSLDVEIFAYIRTSDINEFLAIREELLLAMMDVVAECGSGFAFPSQTIYGATDAGIDSERARIAAQEARRWPAEPLGSASA